MYRAAQFIVRNKVVVLAAAVGLFLVFGRTGDTVKKASPWDNDAAQAEAASSNQSLTSKAVGAVAGAAKDYAGVDVSKVLPEGVNPTKLRDDTVNNWQSVGEAAKKANGN